MNLHFDPETEKRIAAEVERRVAARLAESDKLQQKLEHLASFPDFNPNPVIGIDTHGEVTYCNRPARDTFLRLGMDTAEAAALLARNPEETCETFGGEEIAVRRHEVRIKDRYFAVSCHYARPLAIVRIYAHDITGCKQAEEATRKSETHLRSVLDNLVTLVGVMTPDGTLVEANRVVLEMAGLDPGEVIDKPFPEAYCWSWSPEVQEQLWEAIRKAAAGEVSRYDVVVRMAEGRLVTIDFMLAPLSTTRAGSNTSFRPPSTSRTGCERRKRSGNATKPSPSWPSRHGCSWEANRRSPSPGTSARGSWPSSAAISSAIT